MKNIVPPNPVCGCISTDSTSFLLPYDLQMVCSFRQKGLSSRSYSMLRVKVSHY